MTDKLDTAAIRTGYATLLDALISEDLDDAARTIVTLCDALDELRADMETCTAKRDEWADRAMTELGNVLDLRAENEKLRRMLDLRGTGPAERYWEGRWRDEAADNGRLRAALMSIERIGIAHSDSFARQIKEAQDIARAALGREVDA